MLLRDISIAGSLLSSALLGSLYVGIQLPLLSAILSTQGGLITTFVVFAVSVTYLVRFGIREEFDSAGKVLSRVDIGPSISAVSGWFGAKDVSLASSEYTRLFREDEGGNVDVRKANYMKMVNAYYDLVTDFYEWGWGKSFHFARRFTGETFVASLARAEHWLAAKGEFKPGQTVLDLGCGVGGPMRTIARFTGATIVGINNNLYQITRGSVQTKQAGLASQCTFRQSDFMRLALPDNFADAAYEIEATCHAPDKVACFREILRVLKPGAIFVGYEWCMTDRYDPSDAEHRRIKHDIEEGDSLPDICQTHEVDAALRAAGFEFVEAQDLAVLEPANSEPWYATLEADGLRKGVTNFKQSRLGIFLTHWLCWLLETIRLAPKGTTATHAFLIKAPPALVAGGRKQIFTPMYYFKARKPIAAQ